MLSALLFIEIFKNPKLAEEKKKHSHPKGAKKLRASVINAIIMASTPVGLGLFFGILSLLVLPVAFGLSNLIENGIIFFEVICIFLV